MSTQALTLFEIDADLYRLYQERQEMMDLMCLTREAEDERAKVVLGIDGEIGQHVRGIVQKVDATAYVIREFRADAEAHRKEGTRLLELARREEATAEEIKQRAAEVLAARFERDHPGAIAAATQGTYLDRVKGKYNTLILAKNPPAVDPNIDMSLLPDELARITITFTVAEWLKLRTLLDELPDRDPLRHRCIVADKIEPMKGEIAARLKQMVPCERCNGAQRTGVLQELCPECHGTGKQLARVPGARLITDSVHLRLS